MLDSKTIKIVLVILLSLVLLGVSTSVFATTPTNVTVITDPNASGTTTNRTNTTTNVTNPINSTNTTTTQGTTNRTNTTTYGNSTLPQTGSADYLIIGFVVICIISAVYAYKKVRDYKV